MGKISVKSKDFEKSWEVPNIVAAGIIVVPVTIVFGIFMIGVGTIVQKVADRFIEAEE